MTPAIPPNVAPQPGPAVRAPQPKPIDCDQLIQEIDDWCVALRSARAGYTLFTSALAQVRGQTLPDGPRPFPVGLFAATANGRDHATPKADYRKIKPEEIEWALIPLINLFAAEIDEAIEEINLRAPMVREALAKPLEPQTS